MAQKQQHHDDEAQDRDPVSPPESPLKPLAKDRSDNTFGKELAIASLSLEDDDESFPAASKLRKRKTACSNAAPQNKKDNAPRDDDETSSRHQTRGAKDGQGNEDWS